MVNCKSAKYAVILLKMRAAHKIEILFEKTVKCEMCCHVFQNGETHQIEIVDGQGLVEHSGRDGRDEVLAQVELVQALRVAEGVDWKKRARFSKL